jgi:hypothetical protein
MQGEHKLNKLKHDKIVFYLHARRKIWLKLSNLIML